MQDQAKFSGSKMTVFADPRITRVGRWLRKTKIDEIPQLINILKGEMSVVGPRPKVPEQILPHSSSQEKVLGVAPGLTGPATLAFIDEETVLAGHLNEEDFYLRVLVPVKLDLDLAYCKSITFLGNVRLIALTIVRLIYRPKPMLRLEFRKSYQQ